MNAMYYYPRLLQSDIRYFDLNTMLTCTWTMIIMCIVCALYCIYAPNIYNCIYPNRNIVELNRNKCGVNSMAHIVPYI